MTLVVDASVAFHWFFESDKSAPAQTILSSGEPLIAPDLVMAEIASAAWKASMFSNVPPSAAQTIVLEAQREFDELVPCLTLKDGAIALALELRHSVYDCFYLALAERRQTHVVTADQRLIRRCAGTRFSNLVRPL